MSPELAAIALVVGLFLLGVVSPAARAVYRRWRRRAEVLFGSALVLFGLRLAIPAPAR